MRFFLILLIIILSSISTKIQGQINTQDSLVLVQFYDSTNGDSWIKHTNWKTESPVSTWYGVTVDPGYQRVLYLILRNNNLNGKIPSSIGNLLILSYLDLGHNNLTGSIPTSIGFLTYLGSISLDSNKLTGNIPDSLGNAKFLDKLDLSFNQLSGPISSFIGFAFIQYLNLDSNQLTGSIPSTLTYRGNLYFLNISRNHLSGTVPSTLYDHDSLKGGTLSLYGNQLTFAGMEMIAQEYANAIYAPQATIPITRKKDTLYVSPGGTLIFDTLRWYKNGILDTVVVGDTSLILRSTGLYSVIVRNAIVQKLTLYSDTVNVLSIGDSLLPEILNFTPNSGLPGTSIRIKGRQLTSTTSVSFGGVPAASFTINSDSIIAAIVGKGASGKISITTANGIAVLGGFTFLEPQPPVINSFSPTSGGEGTTISIYGEFFTGANAVSFGGSAATSYSVIADTSIIAIVGNGATGDVVIMTANGADTLGGFTYIGPGQVPFINSFTPTTGEPGTIVSITGGHFSGTTAISFGGIPAASFVLVSDSVISAVVGEGGSGNLSITTANGTGSLGGFIFVSSSVGPPFKLIQFTGILVGIKAQLQWLTKDDQDITSYTIESSEDSILFSSIGTIKSMADTGINNYSFVDSLLQYSVNYYRLEILDKSGNTTFSNIISVQLPLITQPITIYPNPANGYTIVEHPIINTSSQIQVLDMTGRIVRTVQVDPNVVQSRVDLTGLPPGLYRIVWTGGSNSYSLTLLID